jgi:hypothetical protein
MSNVVLTIRPGTEAISWEAFRQTHPPYSIALDGYVHGASRYDSAGPWLNLDHHADVDRLSTRATCAQVWLCLRQGLFDAFRDVQGPRARVFVNDCDEDVCVSWFLLNHPHLAGVQQDRLERLIQAVDGLDTTAGASLHPPDDALLRQLAWIFEPYRQARAKGALVRADARLQHAIVAAVGDRMSDHLAGRGQALPLDKRYQRIGGGAGWALVREIGSQARAGMVADGIRAYVAVLPLAESNWSYTVGRVSPFVRFDVPEILQALNRADESWRGTWGGGNLV